MHFFVGNIHPVSSDPDFTVECMCVDDTGEIKFIGNKKDADDICDSATSTTFPSNQHIYPGFIDSHAHPQGGGLQMLGVNLRQAGSLDECIRRLEDRLSANRDEDEWIFGAGWELHWFDERGYPIADDLERLSKKNPLFLRDRDGHQAWVNHRVLQMMQQVIRECSEEQKASIRCDELGKPLGWFTEAAVGLIKKVMPSASIESRISALTLGLKHANENGITTILDAAVTEPMLMAYLHADQHKMLSCRVRAALLYDTASSLQENMEWMKKARSLTADCKMLNCNTVKLMVDGIIENNTAWMLHPYHYPPESGSGHSFFKENTLNEAILAFHQEGFQIHAHTIGDAATRAVLDAVETSIIISKNNNKNTIIFPSKFQSAIGRTTLAHLQVVQPEDLCRFARLEIAASLSPLWTQMDKPMTKLVMPRLGHERTQLQYPTKSCLDVGAVLAFGSDWPVTSINPLHGIAVAVNHKGIEAQEQEDGFLCKEMVSRLQGLHAYTQGSAFALGIEQAAGTLQIGKFADFIVVDKNLSHSPEIASTCILQTYVNGTIMHK